MRGKLVSIQIQRAKYVLSDWVTGMLGLFLFNIFRYYIFESHIELGQTIWEYLSQGKMLLEQLLIPIYMLGVYWLSGYYNHPFGKSRLVEMGSTLVSSLVNTVVIYLTLLINDQFYGRYISYELIVMLFLCLFTFTYIGRLGLTQEAIRHFKMRKWSFNTVMIGDSDEAMKVANRLRNSQSKLGYNIMAHIHLPGETASKENHATMRREQLDSLCRRKLVDQILIVPEAADEKKVLYLIYNLLPLGVPIRLAPTALSILSSNIKMQDVYAEPFIDISSPAVSECSKNIKRAIDVVASSVALLVLSPVFAITAIAIKRNSKGPVFYSQERIGYHQKPFRIWKFRSMVNDAEADGPQLSDDDDPRVTSVGKFMRKYRIDELPQFWNVLKGDMSLVGPRPEREYFIDKIVRKAPYYTLVHQVRPGLTSWGMVKFGYARTIEEMVERTHFDLIYLANMSLTMDLKIMIHTVNTVFSGKGV